MYFPQMYKGLSQEQIKQAIEEEGFHPIVITDTAGFVYHLHKHPETKVLAFLTGSMEVITEGKTYHCIAGDKLIISGNTLHEGVVGKDGCSFFWSEKIV